VKKQRRQWNRNKIAIKIRPKFGRIFDFVCIIARCANGCRLRRMVIRFAEWLFAYGKMIISLRENDNRLRRMIICLRQNKGKFPSLAARKFSFLLKKTTAEKFDQTFQSLRILKAEP
jgi:hypothetical protein